MKGLRDFQSFNMNAFIKDKDIRVLASEEWKEYSEDSEAKVLGTKYKCVIVTDNTVYKNEGQDLNAGEQIVVKVAKIKKEFQKFAMVKLINPSGVIYGNYQSDLSVKADDIDFIENK